MNRTDAKQAALRVATAITAFEENGDKKGAAGVRLTAMMLADVIGKRGSVESLVWLSWCGIYPKGREKTFRGEPKLSPSERVIEAMDSGNWSDAFVGTAPRLDRAA